MVSDSHTLSKEQGAGLPAPFSISEFDRTMVTVRTSLFGEKEFNSIKDYLTQESAPVPNRKAIGDLFNLSRDLVQRIAVDVREKSARVCELTAQVMEKDALIESLREEISNLKASEKKAEEQVSDLGMDSVDLAKALCWRSRENGHVLYRNQMQTMLYIMYGRCLARSGRRMTSEHPQAWEYGPVFPRVYSKVKTTDDPSYREQSDRLKESSPEVSELLDETVSRCSWRACRELLAVITAKGTPCAESRGRNPERKTAPLEDADIREWFSSRSRVELMERQNGNSQPCSSPQSYSFSG